MPSMIGKENPTASALLVVATLDILRTAGEISSYDVRISTLVNKHHPLRPRCGGGSKIQILTRSKLTAVSDGLWRTLSSRKVGE